MKHKEALVGIPLLVTLALVAGIWIGYSFIPSDSRSGHPEAKVGEISGLDDQFRTFHAGRCGDVECGSFARIVASGHFCYSVGFGVEHVGLCVAQSYEFNRILRNFASDFLNPQTLIWNTSVARRQQDTLLGKL